MKNTNNNSLLPKQSKAASFAASYYESRVDHINLIDRNSEYVEQLNRLVLFEKPEETKTAKKQNANSVWIAVDNYNSITKHEPLPNGYVITSGISSLKETFHKVYQYSVIQFKEQTTPKSKPTTDQMKVHFDTGEFLELCGRSNTKQNRKMFITRSNLEDMLNLLVYSSIVIPAKNHKTPATLRIFSDIKPVRGGFDIWLGPNLAETLVNAQVTFFPLELFHASGAAYYIGDHLSKLYYMDSNARTDKYEVINGVSIRFHIVSVQSLLNYCTVIPTLEEARDRNYRQTELIRKPFEAAIEELFEGTNTDGEKDFPSFLYWNYCKEKGELLTDEELANLDFDSWRELYVRYALQESPEGIEHREERMKKNDKKRKKEQDQIEKARNEAIGKALAKQD